MANNIGDMVVSIIADNAQFNRGIDASKSKFEQFSKTVTQIGADISKSITQITNEEKVWGVTTDSIKAKQQALKNTISELIAAGVDPLDDSIEKLQNEYFDLGKQSDDLARKQISLTDKLKKVGETAVKVGRSLTLFVTGPILAAGAAMIKFASDTQESLNAATVVFGDSTSIITEWGKNAATQAGLSAAEFYQAGAVIGAGLQQAGASAEQAANQTIDLTKRAADMASIFNTSVNDALVALQSGLRGESEPLRRFAVNLNEAAVVAKAVALGLAADTNSVSDYARSQARLAIIMEQTNRFQGDFVNTSDGLANGLRVTTAQLKEVAAEMGEKLLPIVLDVLNTVKDLVSWFADLSDGGQKTVLVIGAMAAAIGPLLIGIGQLLVVLPQLTAAFAGLGGPIALGIAATAAVIAVMAGETAKAKREQLAYNEALAGRLNLEDTLAALAAKRLQVQEMTNALAALEAQAGRAGVAQAITAARANLARAQGELSQIRQVADGYIAQNAAQVRAANSAGALASAITSVGSASEIAINVTKEFSKYTAVQAWEVDDLTDNYEEYGQSLERIWQAMDSYTESVEANAQAEREAAKAREEGLQKVATGLNLAASVTGNLKKAIDSLDESLAKTFGSIADIVSQIALASGTAEGAIVAAAAQLAKGIVDVLDSIFNQAKIDAEAIADLTLEKNKTLIDNQIKTLNILNSEEERAREKRLQGIIKESDAKLKAIDDALQAELEALGLQDKSEAERLRDDIATAERRGEFAKKKALEEELAKAAIFEKYELQREAELAARAAQEQAIADEKLAAEEKFQAQMRFYNREKAISDKAIAVAQIKIAEQKALSEIGFFNTAGKAAVKGLYAELLASVNGIPIPNLAQGAIIQPRAGGTMVNVAEAGVPEIVGPIDKVTQMLQTMGSGALGGSDGNIHLVVNMEGKPFLDKIFQATRNRTVLISAGAIV